MTWHTWKPALALGAVLAATGAASAGDRDTVQLAGGPGGSTTMTLGGRGTAAQAATEDTELARGYHGGGHYGGYHGGHYGWGGGYGGYRGYYGGYRGGYYSGYRGYYGGGYYRPYYASYYRPYYGYGGGYYGGGLGYGGFYTNYYNSYYPSYYGGGCGVYLGISGGSAVAGVPTVVPGTNFARPVDTQPMAQPVPPGGDGTFPYDGGPANPVPLPKIDPQAIPPANPSATATDLPVSGKAKSPFVPATTPYKYKAYGEK